MGILVGKEYQCVNRLRRTLNIEREGLIVIVFRRPVWKEESMLPKTVSFGQYVIKAIITGALGVVFEAVQDIGRVKVVKPMLIRVFPV